MQLLARLTQHCSLEERICSLASSARHSCNILPHSPWQLSEQSPVLLQKQCCWDLWPHWGCGSFGEPLPSSASLVQQFHVHSQVVRPLLVLTRHILHQKRILFCLHLSKNALPMWLTCFAAGMVSTNGRVMSARHIGVLTQVARLQPG